MFWKNLEILVEFSLKKLKEISLLLLKNDKIFLGKKKTLIPISPPKNIPTKLSSKLLNRTSSYKYIHFFIPFYKSFLL
jgi:hypothetical protein